MPFEELKQRQAVLWSAGPYQGVTETIADIDQAVLELDSLEEERREQLHRELVEPLEVSRTDGGITWSRTLGTRK